MKRFWESWGKTTPTFTDIEGHWAQPCILELVARKLILGYPEGKFRPNDTLSRAEFAALLYWVFPKAVPIQQAIDFADVPTDYWARRAIRWGYERGFFSGFFDQTFQPEATLSRLQALLVLANGLELLSTLRPRQTLEQFYDDAAEVPNYATVAIAAATLGDIVVNYPDVRQLRPNQPITRGELAALLCRVFQPDTADPMIALDYTPWSTPLEAIPEGWASSFSALNGNPILVRQMQTRLHTLKLYPNETGDGRYDATTQSGLKEFRRVLGFSTAADAAFEGTLAQALVTVDPTYFLLELARDRDRVYQDFFRQQEGYSMAKLPFLDRGLAASPLAGEVANFPTYLTTRPAAQAPAAVLSVSSAAPSLFNAFPRRGDRPSIDTSALAFLHPDIPYACVCLGQFENGQLGVRWLGRNALANVQLWSATKFVAPLQAVVRANASVPSGDVDDWRVRPSGGGRGWRFYDLMVDMANYSHAIATSNAIGAMFKQFDTPANLEGWIRRTTGNMGLTFRGRYGSGSFMGTPELWDERLQRSVLRGVGASSGGENLMSTYDLTRLLAMVGWHLHLPPEAQFQGAQWKSLESIARSLGADSARYVDVALEQLGLLKTMRSPVVFSKLGFGRSSERGRTELVYTAFVQFIDTHRTSLEASDEAPNILRTLCMTLVGVKDLNNGDRESTELDARMAAEVTELLRRVVTNELA